MSKIQLLQSEDQLSTVAIENGELISYQKNNIEFIHQKNDEGWNNSDTEMFPIIGPTVKNNYKVITQKGTNILDQHGLLREFPYILKSHTQKQAIFTKTYQKNTLLKNRKFPNKSIKEHIFWLYDFHFQKKFILDNNSLEIIFNFSTEEPMPFMLGYHPAFALSNNKNESFQTTEKNICLQEVFDAGADAYPVLECSEIILQHSDKNSIKITTQGFDNFMLWSETATMVCIEPITQFPDLKNQNYSEKNMRISDKNNHFSVKIAIL